MNNYTVILKLKSTYDVLVLKDIKQVKIDRVVRMLILEDKEDVIVYYNLSDVLRFTVYPRKEADNEI